MVYLICIFLWIRVLLYSLYIACMGGYTELDIFFVYCMASLPWIINFK